MKINKPLACGFRTAHELECQCIAICTLHIVILYNSPSTYNYKRSLLVTGSYFDIAGGTCSYNDGSLDYNSICYSG